MITKYDLHSHTHYSDGRLTVSELLDRAVERNVDVLAITDHDSVQAISEANRLIDEKQLPLSLVSGVEISTKWHSFEIHVVGLDINIASSALVDLLDSQTQKEKLAPLKLATDWPKRATSMFILTLRRLPSRDKLRVLISHRYWLIVALQKICKACLTSFLHAATQGMFHQNGVR